MVGGGGVAERKVTDLLNADATVRLVSPDITEALKARVDTGQIVWLQERYSSEHLQNVWLVFAATNVREVNAKIAQDATERHLFVNVADAPHEGTFMVPTVVRRGKLCLSVSTGGANPILARKIAQELSEKYGEEYASLVELLGEMRALSKTKSAQALTRKRDALSYLLVHQEELLHLLRSGDRQRAHARAIEILNDFFE